MSLLLLHIVFYTQPNFVGEGNISDCKLKGKWNAGCSAKHKFLSLSMNRPQTKRIVQVELEYIDKIVCIVCEHRSARLLTFYLLLGAFRSLPSLLHLLIICITLINVLFISMTHCDIECYLRNEINRCFHYEPMISL